MLYFHQFKVTVRIVLADLFIAVSGNYDSLTAIPDE